MSKFTFADMMKHDEERKRIKHKALLRKYGNNAIGRIKQEIPAGKTLHEYLDELKAEIKNENAKNGME